MDSTTKIKFESVLRCLREARKHALKANYHNNLTACLLASIPVSGSKS